MNTLQSYISESLLDMDNVDNSDALIEEFLKKNYHIQGSYTIKDGIVSTPGVILLTNTDIDSLTGGLFKFGTVHRFICINANKLYTLEGAPDKVIDFNCSYCKSLKTLEGAPRKVTEDFMCRGCDSLTSLEGAPKEVWGSFICSECKSLKSLQGAPRKVGESFECSFCDSLESLEGAPREVGGNFHCQDCDKLKSLKGIPQVIKKNLCCWNCKSLSWTGIDMYMPKKLGGKLYTIRP